MGKILAAVVIMALLLAGCGDIQQPQQQEEKASINGAKEIQIQSQVTLFSGKEYEVTVDGKYAGKVQGKLFNGFGDKFTLYDENGNITMTETQLKRSLHFSLSREAVVNTPDGKVEGYIGETLAGNIANFGKGLLYLFDKDGKKLGYSHKTKFTMLDQYSVSDESDKQFYTIDEQFSPIVNTYILKAVGESPIPIGEAVLLTCIQDAIHKSDD